MQSIAKIAQVNVFYIDLIGLAMKSGETGLAEECADKHGQFLCNSHRDIMAEAMGVEREGRRNPEIAQETLDRAEILRDYAWTLSETYQRLADEKHWPSRLPKGRI
tara:strand:- start:5587 stop:5904 length:318 start_codon:yes stop_codon:yes gene_type:complete